MYTRAELMTLAGAFSARQGIALSTLSRLILGNDKVLPALAEGKDCFASHAEELSGWLDTNWPSGLGWPDEIPRRPRRHRLPAPLWPPRQVVIRGVTYTATF